MSFFERLGDVLGGVLIAVGVLALAIFYVEFISSMAK